ncbi:unnamed protein product [Durusdinium trenchii]|uniref:Vesicle transport protein n=2 Tax=Durusdinium trenchii TaxID=1381693 RepID=A0ABP0R6X8_9DINO
MFPIGGPLPVLVGELTPEMQEKLRKIRFCVMGTFLAAIGRFCTGDIPVSELLCGIVGIFLLNEDPNVAPCYACLASSPLGQCSMGHGLSCCLTYSFLAAMNSIFLMLKLLTGGPFVLVSFCCQASGAFLAMKLNALVSREELLGAGPGGPGSFGLQGLQGLMPPGGGAPPGGPPGGPPPGSGPSPFGGGGGGGGASGAEMQPFQAFQGTGMRLGG